MLLILADLILLIRDSEDLFNLITLILDSYYHWVLIRHFLELSYPAHSHISIRMRLECGSIFDDNIVNLY